MPQFKKVAAELKPHVYDELKKKILRTRIARVTEMSEQTIRLWAVKKDVQLLRYDIVSEIADFYKTDIKSLLVFIDKLA
jgi:hypothetical protein